MKKPLKNTGAKVKRVLIATIGMQRYDWEQGTVAQALLEMGEYDLVVSFARAAIMRQVEGRFSVIRGNMPITDCASVGAAVLFPGTPVAKPSALFLDSFLGKESVHLHAEKFIKQILKTHIVGLIWTTDSKRRITGADLLGRLLKGI